MSASSSTTKIIGFTPQFYLQIAEDRASGPSINQTFTIHAGTPYSSSGIVATNRNGCRASATHPPRPSPPGGDLRGSRKNLRKGHRIYPSPQSLPPAPHAVNLECCAKVAQG